MAADSEISLLSRGPMPSKATHKTWSTQLAEEEGDGNKEADKPSLKFMPPEGGIPSPHLRGFESELSSIHEVSAESRQSDPPQTRLSLSFDTSQVSVRSTDTTLEYFDAPLSEEQGEEEHMTAAKDEELVTLNVSVQDEKEEAEKPSPTTEQSPLLTSEDVEGQEEAKEEEIYEEVLGMALEQEAKSGEVQSEKLDEQNVDLSCKQDTATLDQDDASSHDQGNLFTLLYALRLTNIT